MSRAAKSAPIVVMLDRIREVLPSIDVLPTIERGFVEYSAGRVVVPPVAEMIFDDPPGDVHIKYGYIKGDDTYAIKVASGFYDPADRGHAVSDGLMLLFRQKTGRPVAILLDEGHLTNVRTAAAGAVAANYLAPKVARVGILGAGVQGRMQAQWLRKVRDVSDLLVWGIDDAELAAYRRDMEKADFRVRTTLDAEEVADTCSLIVTCTPSTRPLLMADWIRPGTHITAMGSDTAEKQELDPQILAKADLVVADSLSQAEHRGECYRAMAAGVLRKDKIVELGTVISDVRYRRRTGLEITVADLTGVAVQDIQIAKAVWQALQK